MSEKEVPGSGISSKTRARTSSNEREDSGALGIVQAVVEDGRAKFNKGFDRFFGEGVDSLPVLARDATKRPSRSDSKKTLGTVLKELEYALRPRYTQKRLSSRQDVIHSRPFLLMVYFAIVVSSIQLGIEVDYPGNENHHFWVEVACNCVFVIEFLTKFAVLRWEYFRHGWNVFDFCIVSISILDLAFGNQINGGGQAVTLRSLRLVRTARVLRLMKVFRELWLIVLGIVHSLRAMMWVILLLVVILYMGAVVCTLVMQENKDVYPGNTTIENITGGENMEYFNPTERFGTIPRSMHTLFQLSILSEFPEFGRPIFEKDPLFFWFFIVFIIFVCFGVLNVLVGVIVEITMSAAANLKDEQSQKEIRRKLELLQKVRDCIFKLDSDKTGTITLNRLEEAYADDEVYEELMSIGFPVDFTAKELWALLDQDGSGHLTVSEFIRVAFRVVNCANDVFQFQCLTFSKLSRLQQHLVRLEKGVATSQQTREVYSTHAASSDEPFDVLKFLDTEAGEQRLAALGFVKKQPGQSKSITMQSSKKPKSEIELACANERVSPSRIWHSKSMQSVVNSQSLTPESNSAARSQIRGNGDKPSCQSSCRTNGSASGCRRQSKRSIRWGLAFRQLRDIRRMQARMVRTYHSTVHHTAKSNSRQESINIVERIRNVVPEVNDMNEVREGQISGISLSGLSLNGVEGLLPRGIPLSQLKLLLEDSSKGDGLTCEELISSLELLESCRGDNFMAFCTLLAAVKGTHRETLAVTKTCRHALLRTHGAWI